MFMHTSILAVFTEPILCVYKEGKNINSNTSHCLSSKEENVRIQISSDSRVTNYTVREGINRNKD